MYSVYLSAVIDLELTSENGLHGWCIKIPIIYWVQQQEDLTTPTLLARIRPLGSYQVRIFVKQAQKIGNIL